MADTIGWTDDGVTITDATKRRASLTLAGAARDSTRHARDAAELATWLDMLGLRQRGVPLAAVPADRRQHFATASRCGSAIEPSARTTSGRTSSARHWGNGEHAAAT